MKQPYLWHFLTSPIWHCNTLLKAFFFFLRACMSTSYTITKYTVLSLYPTNVCLVFEYCLERSMTKCNLIWKRMLYRCTVWKESKCSRRCPMWACGINKQEGTEVVHLGNGLSSSCIHCLWLRQAKPFPCSLLEGAHTADLPSRAPLPSYFTCMGIITWDLSTFIKFFQQIHWGKTCRQTWHNHITWKY